MNGLISLRRRMFSVGGSSIASRRLASLKRHFSGTMMLFFRFAEMSGRLPRNSSTSSLVTRHSGMSPKWGRTYFFQIER